MLITLLLGSIAFSAWLYAFGPGRKAAGLLQVSAIYFVGGGLLAGFPALAVDFFTAQSTVISRSLTMFFTLVIAEETLKLLAARTQKRATDVFALLSLFGIYELLIYKSLVLLFQGESIGFHFGSLLSVPALFMHTLTAGIYAFVLPQRPAIQFAVCVGLHALFNAFAEALISSTASEGAFLLLIIPLAAATILVWRNRPQEHRNLRVEGPS